MSDKPEYPERTFGFTRMELRPILKMGAFVTLADGGYRLVDGWIFDHGPAHAHKPQWSADLLREMIQGTLATIKALPGPATW